MPLLLPKKYGDPVSLLETLKTAPESKWIRAGEERVLKLFREMAKRVPAYKDFLRKSKFDASKIKNMADFRRIPTIDKNGYLKAYSLDELCWDGKFKERRWDISSTSGSTGEPFYFPREASQNWQYAMTAELYLRTNFEIHEKSTLYVNCFALGVWIGGIFTYEALKIVSERGGYKLSIINPGLNKAEIIKTIQNLGDKFDQVIIGGYPPFVKDVVDDGVQTGLDWKKYNIKFIFSAEGFSEEFRDYIAEKTGLKNICRDTLNHYGTVDQGTIAHETPISILVRRLAIEKPQIFKELFQENHRLPTLAQYDPELFFFEEVDGGLLCSAYSGLPLVRYDLKDNGGVFKFDLITATFNKFGVDLFKEANKAGIGDTIWHFPFVYVYERKDLSVSIGGANVYPETIKMALCHEKIQNIITGKFSIGIEYDAKQNQCLLINIELKNGIKQPDKNTRKFITSIILENLLKNNSEFRSMFYDQRQGKAIPRVVFWPYEHPTYFKVGGKQKWAITNKK